MALLGPNGAGKTTNLRILATLLRPDAGRAEVTGLDAVRQAAAVRLVIGLTGQYAAPGHPATRALSWGFVHELPSGAVNVGGKPAELLIYRVFLTVPQGTPGIQCPLDEQRRNEPRAQGTCRRLSR